MSGYFGTTRSSTSWERDNDLCSPIFRSTLVWAMGIPSNPPPTPSSQGRLAKHVASPNSDKNQEHMQHISYHFKIVIQAQKFSVEYDQWSLTMMTNLCTTYYFSCLTNCQNLLAMSTLTNCQNLLAIPTLKTCQKL